MTGVRDVRASRRIVFSGLGALGVAVALAGCASGDDGDGGDTEVAAGTELTTTDEVPIGGGVILTDERIVVTQPTEGEFMAFTAVCTHQQQTVTSVQDNTIMCAHHGSQYDAATGKVTGGPAPSALASILVKVDGKKIVTA